jgi:F-type H+-transporting ATPase subunit b
VNQFAPMNLLASAISIDFDPTFIAQFLLFATFIVVLRPLLFDPLLKVFEERERRTEGAKEDAREWDAKAGELRQRYEAEEEQMRREAGLEREKIRNDAKAIEAKLMAEARADAARILDSGKARIAAEVEQMRKELAETQPVLASEIAARVLGREVGR